MTSKGLEMLEILKQRNGNLKINHKIGSRDIANQEIKEITQCFDNYVIPVIEKELKVLEILKKWIVVNETYDDLFPYEIKVKNEYVSNRSCLILTEEDYRKIKEWLENE